MSANVAASQGEKEDKLLKYSFMISNFGVFDLSLKCSPEIKNYQTVHSRMIVQIG
jgi:hypothetical protein